jgi:hypothetical protein
MQEKMKFLKFYRYIAVLILTNAYGKWALSRVERRSVKQKELRKKLTCF